MSPQHTSPLGSVSARHEFAQYASDARRARVAALADELSLLAQWSARAFDLEEEQLALAWELVGLVPALAREPQRAALLLTLVVMIHARQGSTCLPLQALSSVRGPQDSPLLATLRALIPPEAQAQDPWRPEALCAQILALLRADALGAIVGDVQQYKPLILDQGALYTQRLLFYEQRLVDALAQRFFGHEASIPLAGVEQALVQVLEHPARAARGPILLTSEQRDAALTCLRLPWCMITGGPGTGKTSIVVTILRLAARQGVEPSMMLLAAPTGKAAHRMQESILAQLASIERLEGVEHDLRERLPAPQTLHRLLGYQPHSSDFVHHEHNPLAARIVVVDEASMIDMFMMERLVRALGPRTHLVLLGDADQLPSVEAGAVFRELIAPAPHWPTPSLGLVDPPAPLAAHTVRLTQSHRMRPDDPQGRHILLSAQAVRRGDASALLSGPDALRLAPGPDSPLRLSGVEVVGGMLDLAEAPSLAAVQHRLSGFVGRWFDACVPSRPWDQWCLEGFDGQRFDAQETQALTRLFEQLGRARLLCLTRVFATGTQAVNALCVERLRAQHGLTHQGSFLAGCPVMMTRNDYDKDLFNGDQGVILRVRVGGVIERMAVFGRSGGFVAFALDALRRDLELAFAMTVHKSQGSEFEHVGLILPAEPIPLLTRELLYTAMTRASRSVTLFGPLLSLRAGVEQRQARHTGHHERFAQALAAGPAASAQRLDPRLDLGVGQVQDRVAGPIDVDEA